MNECPYKNFRGKVLEFINILRKPRQEYSGLPPCPFVGAEVDNDKLMIELFDPSTNTILEMIEVFVESKYDSALFVQVIKETIPPEETFEYQSFINRAMKKAGYDELKCICFNPNDSVNVEGFNIRQYAPYFLINIANKNVLAKAHKKILSTKYFDNMEKEYLDYLHVKEEHLRRNK